MVKILIFLSSLVLLPFNAHAIVKKLTQPKLSPAFKGRMTVRQLEGSKFFIREKPLSFKMGTITGKSPILGALYTKYLFWVYTARHIISYSSDGKLISQIDFNQQSFFDQDDAIVKIAQGKQSLWIQSKLGIYNFKFEDKKWVYYDLSLVFTKYENKGLKLQGIAFDGRGLWIGSNKGLVFIDQKTKTMSKMLNIKVSGSITDLSDIKVIYGDDAFVFISSGSLVFSYEVDESRWRFVPYRDLVKVSNGVGIFIFFNGQSFFVADKTNFRKIKELPVEAKVTDNFAFNLDWHAYLLFREKLLLYNTAKKQRFQVDLEREIESAGTIIDLGFVGDKLVMVWRDDLRFFELGLL